jgi:hypothetical protein
MVSAAILFCGMLVAVGLLVRLAPVALAAIAVTLLAAFHFGVIQVPPLLRQELSTAEGTGALQQAACVIGQVDVQDEAGCSQEPAGPTPAP